MSRLANRGPNKASPYGGSDAQKFIDRASQSHTVQWKVDALKWDEAGAPVTLLEDVPITGGTLTMDSSDPIRRRLTIEVGGGASLVPNQPSDPLVPFGQFLRLFVRIDRESGGWFPWIKQGEFPILSYVYEHPSTIATCEARDYSGQINEYLFLNKRGFKDKKLADVITHICNEGLPNRAFTVDASADAQNTKLSNYVAEAGRGRWDEAVAIAQTKGHETFFDWNGDLVIRHDVTDDNDEAIPGNGPDIGTASNPIAIIKDGPSGNLVALTATITREGGCNGVRINIHPTKTAKHKEHKDDPQYQNASVEAFHESGPVAWGDVFGHLPIVKAKNVQKVTAEVRNGAEDAARHLLHRRRGVVRYIDLDAAGLYWVEPDDKIRISWGTTTEAHFVQAITFDLTGASPTRVRTRQLAVTDPGVFR